MRRSTALAVLLALSALLCGCPRGGGRAQPAKVEIQWPDAAVPATYSDAPPAAPYDAGPAETTSPEL